MNKLMNKQKGIGFWGWSSILAVLGISVLIGLRLWPLYNEKFAVDAAMASVANRPDVDKMSKDEVIRNFKRTIQVGTSSSRFDDKFTKEHVSVDKPKSKGGSRLLTVEFEARNHFFDVIDLVLVYNNSVELGGGRESP